MQMNPQRLKEAAHKIAVLSILLVDEIDAVKQSKHELQDVAIEFRNKCAEIEPYCEMVLKTVFNIDEVKQSTYLNELANKVDTVIRKNYKPLEGMNSDCLQIPDQINETMRDFIRRISGEMLRNDFVLNERWHDQAEEILNQFNNK